MTTISTNNLLSGTNGNALTSTPGSSAKAETDRFLKLLVAQLNNQDPLNPMDNAQMTSQMAQINTVSGIQQLNESVKALSTQFNALQVLQGTSMVGRDVLIPGNSLSVNQGVANGAFNLAGDADKVTLEIRSPAGDILETQQLGATKAGRNDFSWSNADYQGMAATFKVTATQGGKPVAVDPFVRATVSSVSSSNGVMSLQLQDRGVISYDQVTAFL